VTAQGTWLAEPRLTARDARRIGDMWARHGTHTGPRCRTCATFVRVGRGNRVVSTCTRFGVSLSAASDGKGNVSACGRHRERL